jgi:prophage regulatory protein
MAQRFLRISEVMSRTGLSRPTIYRRCKAGIFPRPIPLGNDHIVGWLESSIEEWQQARIDAAAAVGSEHATRTA